MSSVKVRRKAARVFVFWIAAALVFVTAGTRPAVADSLREDRGFSELVGTWIYSEYDGLLHPYEEVTWRADGTRLCYDSYTQSVRSDGPFSIVERQIGSKGCMLLTVVEERDGRAASFLIKISHRGKYYDICRHAGNGGETCRRFFRKEVHRGIPGYRFEILGRKTRYAGYPFNPDRVMPWTKYFWAKA